MSPARPLTHRGPDRRRRATPMLQPYLLRGRRRAGRREGEREGIYTDRWPASAWLLVGALCLLSVVDWGWTVLHLERGTPEANPLLAWTVAHGGVALFSAVKLGVTFAVCGFLLLHAHFRLTRRLLPVALVVYCGVLGIHVWTEAVAQGVAA